MIISVPVSTQFRLHSFLLDDEILYCFHDKERNYTKRTPAVLSKLRKVPGNHAVHSVPNQREARKINAQRLITRLPLFKNSIVPLQPQNSKNHQAS